MSPVSRRRPARGGGPRGRASILDAQRLRHQSPVDALGAELLRLKGIDDAFVVEGTLSLLVEVLDPRGQRPDEAWSQFCRGILDDERAVTSELGLQSLAVVAAMGHRDARADAALLLSGCPGDLLESLPSWTDALGRVHVVEAGALRTPDGGESVLHVMLDYDVEGAGARHLLTIAVRRGDDRVHLLDVRGRGPGDSLEAVGARYGAAEGPVWSWIEPTDLVTLLEESGVAEAVRRTGRHSASSRPVLDVEHAPTPAWGLGVRRLEHVTGLDLRPSD
jgi:hypothetical protein